MNYSFLAGIDEFRHNLSYFYVCFQKKLIKRKKEFFELYLDMKKYFDVTSHDRLLNKIKILENGDVNVYK